MTDRMPLHKLDVPHDPEKIRNAAGGIVIDALIEAGIDPRKAIRNQMCIALAGEWSQAKMTRAQFVHSCRNLLILNPGLALDSRPQSR